MWFGAAPGVLIDESWAPSISIRNCVPRALRPRPPACCPGPTHQGSHRPVRSWAPWPGRRHLLQRESERRVQGGSGKSVRLRWGWVSMWGRDQGFGG